MVTGEKTRDGRNRQAGAAVPAVPERDAGAPGRAGDELLDAADEAIRRALSGDSEAFLYANRQEGGQ